MALQLRPNCEWCDRDLPPEAEEARICSYECTFCADCVETHLSNVCPNCGGGFEKRPLRPANAHRPGVSREHQQPSETRVHLKHPKADIGSFVESLKDLPPVER